MVRGSGSGSGVWRRSALSRRDLFRYAGAGAFGLASRSTAWQRTSAHAEDDQPAEAFTTVELPPDLGQTELQVFVKATGHTVRGSMLDYWRASGAAAIYGNPISEPFAATDGYYSQAFERGVFQYRPEFLYTEDPIIRLMPLGHLALRDRVDVFLGPPLSEPHVEHDATVQWFAGGLLRSTKDGVALAPLAVDLAPRIGIDTMSVPRGELPPYDELLFWMADNPNPMGDPYAPGAKWIEVSIAQQRLWAYQGDTLISTTLVSTGLEPNLTELGMFRVRLKYPEQDLSGFSSDTGEVVGFGDEPPPGTIPYSVEDVPHVMYFNLDAEALHGTYWHNNFGTPMSHGCVNLPLDFAAWLYGWAPLGTGVWIHE